ncbi:4883_t:CDS:2 [Funneliformis geosporum]|uniref:11529_t:CDS:1 n=1 Tax=Funneliformis geosporum TaxID=1117311 RepID=A0A9W4WY04_9GLOM|nr:4883_t:CDS:2 [Funneliformis geosporum]CAI2172004.1 11529_t:CDS:2 [Funneliformis geosporum]
MKIFYKALFALSCIVATGLADPQAKGKGGKTAPPTERLNCKIVEPAPNAIWTMGQPQTVSWSCEVKGPIESQPPEQLIHIELGTGTSKADFLYVDTIDAVAKAREVKFTFNLLETYPEGTNYIVRLRSKLKNDKDPVTVEESNLLPWVYSGPITIIKKGTDPKSLPKAKAPVTKAPTETGAKNPKESDGKAPVTKAPTETGAKNQKEADGKAPKAQKGIEADEPKGKDAAKTKAVEGTPAKGVSNASATPDASSAASSELGNILLLGLCMFSSYLAL